MKHAAILLALILVAGCSSTTTDDTSGDATTSQSQSGKVNIDIAQLTGPSAVQMQAPVDVQLGVGVQNISNEPLTVRRVDIQQLGRGAWVLQPGAQRSFVFDKKVPAHASDEVTFWVHAYSLVPPGNMGGTEPVTMRVIVFFDSPSGQFREVRQKMIEQE